MEATCGGSGMNNAEILKLARRTGVLLSGRAEHEEAVKRFSKLLLDRHKALTPAQERYLRALDDWMSLADLAQGFSCTPQNALKMIRALEAKGLVDKTTLFRGAWAFYYRRKI